MPDLKISDLTSTTATTSHSFVVADGTSANYKVNLATITGNQTTTGDHTATGAVGGNTLAITTSGTVGTTLDVTGDISAANFPGTGGGGNTLFDADVGPGATYTTLKAAIDAGKKVIEVLGSTTETGSITLSANVSIWFKNAALVSMGNNQIIMGGNVIEFVSVSPLDGSGVGFALTTAVPSFSGGGSINAHGVSFVNSATNINSPLIQTSDNSTVRFYNVNYTCPDLAQCGIETGTDSTIDGLEIISASYVNHLDIVILGNDSSAKNITINFTSYPANRLITVGTRAKLDILRLNSGSDVFDIDNYGQITSVNSNGNDISIYAKVQNTIISDCDLGDGSIYGNQFPGGFVSNCNLGLIDLSDSFDVSWTIENSRLTSNIVIEADNIHVTGCDILGSVAILNANSVLIVANQVDSDGGGGSNVITIAGTSNHCIITNNKINTYPLDTTGNDNLIANNSVHGSAPPPTGGDVVGPASSTDSFLVQFDGSTGKLIKELGLPVTSTLTDVSSTAPTNGQIFAYSTATNEWVPTNPASGASSAFYDAIVAPSGGDYTTVSAAVAAGHQYILIDASIAIPITEVADIVLTQTVYIYIKGQWDLVDNQIDFNSVANITLNIEGIDRVNSVMTVSYTTASQPLLANLNSSAVKFKSFHYDNVLAGADLGVIAPDLFGIFEDFKLTAPNSIGNGISLAASSSQVPSRIIGCEFTGGGATCGAIIIPGDETVISKSLINGAFYQAPTFADACTNRHAVIWTDPAAVEVYHINDLYFNPSTGSTHYAFVVTGVNDTWKGSADFYLYTMADNCVMKNIDFGPAGSGGITGWVNSNDMRVDNCTNLFVSNPDIGLGVVNNLSFYNTRFIGSHSTWSNRETHYNSYFESNYLITQDNCRFTNCSSVSGGNVTISPEGCAFQNCFFGVTGSPVTLTIDTGSNNTTVLGCYALSEIVDNGTQSALGYNHTITATNVMDARMTFITKSVSTTPYAATYRDELEVDTTSSDIRIDLPTCVGYPGQEIYVKKVDSSLNTVDIYPAGSETINGIFAFTLTDENESVILISNGSNWVL